jgi:hypothetical protein
MQEVHHHLGMAPLLLKGILMARKTRKAKTRIRVPRKTRAGK